MKEKKAIRYLRISTDRQSHFSIDGQDLHTKHWCERNLVTIVDTFTDEGYSARTFDRPDFKRLTAFIKQHYRNVDYLVVNAFDRFSRDAGEAIVQIKNLQRQFSIKVVSVSEGVTFDADDPGSFFYTGLMLLKGEDEIIRNRSRINLGIYTAKKKEGRYLGAAPIGYKNAKDPQGKPVILPDDDKAPLIRFIFDAYLAGYPLTEIRSLAVKKGFAHTGNSAIQKILKNPVYVGLLHIKAYRDFPEEWVEGIHPPLVDKDKWHRVQTMMGKGSPVTIVNDDMPLRGVLLCHCGKPLTGAPSRGKLGRYYNYYKCNGGPKHNNVSADKAHQQLLEVFHHLSLSPEMIGAIRTSSAVLLEDKMKSAKGDLSRKQAELHKVKTKIESLEGKWIENQVSQDTYQRWHSDLTTKIRTLQAQIEQLSFDGSAPWKLLDTNLDKLSDMRFVYDLANTNGKQQIVKLVFDSRLYYQDKVYRTPYVMPLLTHNLLILKQKNLLVLDKKGDNLRLSPEVELRGVEPLSKHHPNKLSTCLSRYCLSGKNRNRANRSSP